MPERSTADPSPPRVHSPTHSEVGQDPAADERIAAEVRSRLEHHELIDASRVQVPGVNGEVIMIGTADNRFVQLPNVTLTPHSAGASVKTVSYAAGLAAEEVRRYLAGEPAVNRC